jgi:hypothetical protein
MRGRYLDKKMMIQKETDHYQPIIVIPLTKSI